MNGLIIEQITWIGRTFKSFKSWFPWESWGGQFQITEAFQTFVPVDPATRETIQLLVLQFYLFSTTPIFCTYETFIKRTKTKTCKYSIKMDKLKLLIETSTLILVCINTTTRIEIFVGRIWIDWINRTWWFISSHLFTLSSCLIEWNNQSWNVPASRLLSPGACRGHQLAAGSPKSARG